MNSLPFAASSSSSLNPTPPRSSRDKENQCPSSDPSTPRKSRIEFAEQKEVYTFSPNLACRVANLPTPTRGPNKPILKPSRPLAPYTPAKTRDITPSPETPLENSHYLVYPVSTIIDESASLRELTEAYSILAARIRSSVPPDFFDDPAHDTRYRLFQPLCKNAEALTKAFQRDLARVFVDPFELPGSSEPSEKREEASARSPSPKQSSSPKKGGMNEEQAVYARDLQTTASSVVKLLTLVFQSPAIYESFTKQQLKRMLTSSLAIPLAESLRSPCARKVCGFTIGLLQCQRLPDDILETSADRISFALKRALVGELGREGKKGATAEALRAVHDLCIYKPAIFVPELAVYLTFVIDLLTSPSCALRVLAAHALGGYVLALTRPENDFSELLSNISPVMQNAFMERAPSEKNTTTLLQALRTAIRAPTTAHPGQGPFWAISVLASIIILVGPALLKDPQFNVVLKNVIQGGLQTGKALIRGVAETLLGPLIWAWRKWRHSSHLTSCDDSLETDDQEEAKASFQRLLQLLTKQAIGSLFVGSLLGPNQESCQQQDLTHAIYHVGEMGLFGGFSTERALEILDRIVNAQEDASFYDAWETKFVGKLTPPILFSVAPGLLTLEVGTQLTNTIVNSLPNVNDIRPLSQEEKQMKVVWMRVRDAWLGCLGQLSLSPNDPAPPIEIIDIWTGLVKMIFSTTGANLQVRSEMCAAVLVSILSDVKLDLREDDSDGAGPSSIANQHIKLALVSQLWAAAVELLPKQCSSFASRILVRSLVEKYSELSENGDESDESMDLALSEWAGLAASVDSFSTSEVTLKYWNNLELDERSRARIWRAYLRAWSETKNGSWKLAARLLGLPFSDLNPWDMSEPDLSVWNSSLLSAIEVASRQDISGINVVEAVVQCISKNYLAELSASLRAADNLVIAFDKQIDDCTKLPTHLPTFLKNVLEVSYPPKGSNKVVGKWLLRSLRSALDKFSSKVAVEFIRAIQDGLCVWLSDDCGTFTDDEVSDEIVPLFQTLLMQLEGHPVSSTVIMSLSPLVESVIRMDADVIPEERKEAFTCFEEFWTSKCKKLQPPSGGWPVGLSTILGNFSGPSSSINEVKVATAVDAEPVTIDAVSDEEDELDVLPRTFTPRRRTADLVPLPPSPPSRFHFGATTARLTTPKRAPTTSLAGPRLPSLFGTLPLSPSKQKNTHRRTTSQRNHRRTSSSSKSRLAAEAEKENAPPVQHQSSDDIVIDSKRALLDVDSTPLRAAKRPRTDSDDTVNSDDSIADSIAVEILLSSPLGKSRTNGDQPKTPTKRALPQKGLHFARLQGRPEASSPTKRRKTLNAPSVKTADASQDDDDNLPPSSDIESDEEDASSSSSPIGPLTPAERRKAAVPTIRMTDPESDDLFTNSSPTRSVKKASQRRPARPLAPLPLSPVF